jgi:hypothetical protein
MKPTPFQARLLRQLAGEGCYLILYARRCTLRTDDTVYRLVPKESVNIMLGRGWIEEIPYDPHRPSPSRFRLTEGGKRLVDRLPERAFISPPKQKPAMTAAQIVGLLHRRHVPPESFLAANFTVAGDVADAVAFRLYRPHRTTAYEIKVSRGDWKREMADPKKNRELRSVVDEFVWVCPGGLIKKAEVPQADGLMYAWANRLRIVKQATPTFQSRMRRDLVAALLRRHGRDEREAVHVADLLGQIVERVYERKPDAFPSYWRGKQLLALIRRARNLMLAALEAGTIDERARI